MKQFKPSLLILALATTGLLSYQSVAAESDGANNTEVEEVIQVRGIRGSLMRAQAVKMDSTSVVEVISAEDIGKLPDSSIAESLARLPGLAGERRNGRTSGLSVRGFKEDYVGTTLNGREVLGIGDNRGVEYDLYPSEIMSGVTVYKSPDATLTTQGVGGTVDLQTARPLTSESYVAVNLNYEMNGKKSANSDFDDKGHRLALSFSDKFADDTVGIALSIASTSSPSQEDQFRAWGYNDADPDKIAAGVSVPSGESVKFFNGQDSYTRSAVLERDTFAGVIQWAPTEDLTISIDALYIDFLEEEVKRGTEELLGNDYLITAVDGNVATSVTFNDGFHSVIRNDARVKEAKLKALAANFDYQLNADWNLKLDLARSETDKTLTDIESYSGVGRSNTANRPETIRSYNLTSKGASFESVAGSPDLSNFDIIKLAGPQGWGGSLAPYADSDFSDDNYSYFDGQDGFVNEPVFDEELTTLRLDATGYIQWGIFNQITFGAHYSDRSKTKDNGGYFLTAPNWPTAIAIPEEYRVGAADLDFIGNVSVVAYDSIGMYSDGFYTKYDAAETEPDREGDSYTIDETLITLFTKLDLEAELGDIFVKGNLGVQVVDTDQSSTGKISYIDPENPGFVKLEEVNGGAQFTKVLPSLTLNFELTDDMVVRTALSKTLSRPRMDDLRPGSGKKFKFNANNVQETTNPKNGPWESKTGNPTLRPIEANQFDLAYDWYFAEDGFLSAAFFFKDITNWHKNVEVVEDFTEYYIEDYHFVIEDGAQVKPTLFDGISSTRADGLTGYVRGYELQATLPMRMVADVLDGFGMVASAAFTQGGLSDGSNIPGLSEESYQLTAYYELGGFEFRVSGRKRSAFTTETYGGSLALTPTEDAGSELWDAQISYDFGKAGVESLEGLTISLQGQNLTDEDTVQFANGDPRQITQYQTFGANYLLGLNYKF
ncbi:TonB-dependent receptor [Catenovulum sp. 2E275]|uniref:TonB-dependent receptor n=1 Tax=Catenovulum sp. 2E275 TaxID=2980497 RepID=UPI0021D20A28|nr:TonB-dependent receptor [Catenovulum sp. 2E275]MCU4675492.1 TonB-dependent receptor [Catenovulum sp. 2E275]